MNIEQAFPSNYVKASDLNGKPSLLTIRTCVREELGQGNDKEKKSVLYFKEAQKGLVLNKTNANVIADAYGKMTEDWEGKTVEVYPTRVEFKGNLVDGIRVRIQPQQQPVAQPRAQPDAAPMADQFNDEIASTSPRANATPIDSMRREWSQRQIQAALGSGVESMTRRCTIGTLSSFPTTTSLESDMRSRWRSRLRKSPSG